MKQYQRCRNNIEDQSNKVNNEIEKTNQEYIEVMIMNWEMIVQNQLHQIAIRKVPPIQNKGYIANTKE